MSGLNLQRIGMMMEPEPGNPQEIDGVLNPAAVRGPDGELYLFPRLVAKGNYSRIGIARVRFNATGDPEGVERLGIALQPEADYELRPNGGGGCEDPRITFVEPLKRNLMTYAAFSARGPRIALSISEDLFYWRRLDASLFPVAIPNPTEKPELACYTGRFSPRHGWLIDYHGVSEMEQGSRGTYSLRYSAGVMVLSKEHPQLIRFRSTDPVLTPSLPQERDGTLADLVFPTGTDRRVDIGSPDRFDVYYGMAVNRIGVARLDVPELLPPGGVADSPEAKL